LPAFFAGFFLDAFYNPMAKCEPRCIKKIDVGFVVSELVIAAGFVAWGYLLQQLMEC